MKLKKKFWASMITYILMTMMVFQYAVAGEATPVPTPVSNFALSGTVPKDIGMSGIVEAWEMSISELEKAKSDTLPLPVLLRLVATYCHDMSPSQELPNLSLYAPTANFEVAGDVTEFHVDVLTMSGPAHFAVNAMTGELISKEGTVDTETTDDMIGFDQVVTSWKQKYAATDDWEPLMKLTKSTNVLPLNVQLRLLITYYLDAYPLLSLKAIEDFAPCFELMSGESETSLFCSSFTREGDVDFTINPKDGTLSDVSVNQGGNG